MSLTKHGKNVEDLLVGQYGNNVKTLPKTLMFDHISPATRLLEKRRQMFEVQEALNAQKEEFARREDAFRRREDENELKRNRALKRVADERKQIELKEIEIQKLKLQLNNKLNEEKLLKQQLDTNMKYQDYLENVVQNISKFFPEINDILNRHNDYLQYKKIKENQILNGNNEIAELQIRLETIKNQSLRIQADVDQRSNEATDKSLLLGQIMSSVSNILERCEESFHRRHNKPSNEHKKENKNNVVISLNELCEKTLSKLDWIAEYMDEFKRIIAAAGRIAIVSA
eukprot:gene20617-26734_t